MFDEGVVGDSMYVIESGSVEVLRKNPQGEYQQIAVLGDKKFFGEMSLIDKEYRSATVRAKESARLLQLSNEKSSHLRPQLPQRVYLGCREHPHAFSGGASACRSDRRLHHRSEPATSLLFLRNSERGAQSSPFFYAVQCGESRIDSGCGILEVFLRVARLRDGKSQPPEGTWC